MEPSTIDPGPHDAEFARATLDARNVTPDIQRLITCQPDPNGLWIVFPTLGGGQHAQLATSPEAIRAGVPKYLAQPGRTAIPCVLPRPDAGTVLIVEGTYDFLNAAGYGPANVEVWGLYGCWNWMSGGVPLPELAAVRDRRVVIALDGDAEDRRDIYHAGMELKRHLEACGATTVEFAAGLKGKAGVDELVAGAVRDGADPREQLAIWLRNTKPKPADTKPRGAPPTKPTAERTSYDARFRPGPGRPFDVAKLISEVVFSHTAAERSQGTLAYWQGEFYWWVGDHWRAVEEAELNRVLYGELSGWVHLRESDGLPCAWNPTQASVNNVRHALSALHVRPRDLAPTTGLVPVRNGLIDPVSRRRYAPDPAYFCTYALPFEYHDDVRLPEPDAWLRFLGELWPNDPESVRALRQWFGYVISGRTDLQKGLFLRGPKRCGKGTILRVLNHLVGVGNFASPTLSRMATQFGLASLIGKALVTIGDARSFGDRNALQVTEDLLSIIGEDSVTIDRKHTDTWTGRLGVRFAMASNTVPQFRDSAGVVVSRFVFLKLEQSFYGREDHALEGRLLAELPGIFQWALDGLADLNHAGRLLEPASSRELVMEAQGQSNHLIGFLTDRCEFAPEHSVACSDLFSAYTQWCFSTGVRAADMIPDNRMKPAMEELGYAVTKRKIQAQGVRSASYFGVRLA